MWFVKKPDGGQFGPTAEADIVQMIRAGHLKQGFIAPQGSNQWQPLESHPPFAQALAGAQFVTGSGASPQDALAGTMMAPGGVPGVGQPMGAVGAATAPGQPSPVGGQTVLGQGGPPGVAGAAGPSGYPQAPGGGYGQAPGGYGQAPGGYGQAPGGYGQAPGGAYAPAQGGYGQAPGAQPAKKAGMDTKMLAIIGGGAALLLLVVAIGIGVAMSGGSSEDDSEDEDDDGPSKRKAIPAKVTFNSVTQQFSCKGKECKGTLDKKGILELDVEDGTTVRMAGKEEKSSGGKVRIDADFEQQILAKMSPNKLFTDPKAFELEVELDFGDDNKTSAKVNRTKELRKAFTDKMALAHEGVTFGADDVAPPTVRAVYGGNASTTKIFGTADNIKEIDLVARSKKLIRRASCGSYKKRSTGEVFIINKKMTDERIHIHDRRTGKILGTKLVRAKNPACPQTLSSGTRTVYGFASSSTIRDFIKSFIGKPPKSTIPKGGGRYRRRRYRRRWRRRR